MMSYIGKCRGCNNVVGAVVDDPKYKKDTAKTVYEFIEDGLIIERATVEYVRANFKCCECQKDKQLAMF